MVRSPRRPVSRSPRLKTRPQVIAYNADKPEADQIAPFDEAAEALFHEINKRHSTVNLLIGSKKFTEGWSSWRVSTMGLMNVGKGARG